MYVATFASARATCGTESRNAVVCAIWRAKPAVRRTCGLQPLARVAAELLLRAAPEGPQLGELGVQAGGEDLLGRAERAPDARAPHGEVHRRVFAEAQQVALAVLGRVAAQLDDQLLAAPGREVVQGGVERAVDRLAVRRRRRDPQELPGAHEVLREVVEHDEQRAGEVVGVDLVAG